MTDPRKDLPAVSAPNFQERLRETVQTYLGNRGNPLDRGLILRDMVDAGLLKLRPGFSGSGNPIAGLGPNAGGAATDPYVPDLTPPPTPTGFKVDGGFAYVFVETADPTFQIGHGYLRTIVYVALRDPAKPPPTFSDAIKADEFIGTIRGVAANPGLTYHLWVKWETRDNVLSIAPAGGTNGAIATTALDVNALVKAMTGEGKPFTIVPVETVIDGVTYPAATYTTRAFIMDEQVTNSKIKNLAVDNGKIANMGVDKLTAGSLRVGAYISSSNYVAGASGFAMWADGNAQFNNVTVRGIIYALGGQIGGCNINGEAIMSANWNGIIGPTGTGWAIVKDGNAYFNNLYVRGQFNSGSYNGYDWPTDGGNGAHISANGILVGNYLTGGYFQLTANGDLYAPGFSIVGGNATFAGTVNGSTINAATINGGSINGTTGTFAGSLSAAFAQVGTLNIGDDAVTVPRAASGLTVAAVTLNVMAGKPVYLHGYSAGYTSGAQTTSGVIYVGLQVNGSWAQQDIAVVTGARDDPYVPGIIGSVSILFVHYPPTSGAYTYSFSGAGGQYGGAAFIFAMQAKK